MILNKAQAEAVYIAMCALNNVSGRISGTIVFPDDMAVTCWSEGDSTVSTVSAGNGASEYYADQAAFAAAYALE